MRIQKILVGNIVHAYNRGARGMDIVRDEDDRWRFLRLLYFMNDYFYDLNWTRDTYEMKELFKRPSHWPEKKPIVEILAFTLMPNHYHLLLREINEGGISLFMKKLNQSMSRHAGGKYDEIGSIFQGPYKYKIVEQDKYFPRVCTYIMIKNVFELYPKGGLPAALTDFNEALGWAQKYPFSSIGDYIGERPVSKIINPAYINSLFKGNSFKEYSREILPIFCKGEKFSFEIM